jgi:putative FmdB family regulatory protein
MPTYDYKCLSCGHHFELFQLMTADPVTKCFKCDGEVKRLIGAGAGPIFKGSGFYHTDYKNLNKKTPSSTPSSKKNDTKKSSTSKKDKSKEK